MKALAVVEGVQVWASLAQRSLRLVSGRSSVRFESAHIRFLFLFKVVVPSDFAPHDAELKWLTPLPIFMQNQSGGDRIAFGVPPPTGR